MKKTNLSEGKVTIALVDGDKYSVDYDKCLSCKIQPLCKMYDMIEGFCDVIASTDLNYIPCTTGCQWFVQEESNGTD